MSSNAELLQKADMTLAELTSGGGLLPDDTARSFVRRVIAQPTLIKECRSVGMNAPTRKISRIAFGSRILHAAEQVALTEGQRSKPTFDKIELDAKEFKAEIRLPYDAVEDAIESASVANNEASNTGPTGGLRGIVLAMIGDRVAADIEEVALLSDTGSGDADLATQSGWLKLTADLGNTVNYANGVIAKGLFKAGKKALPDQYVRDINAMKHYISIDQETDYRDSLADRVGPLGDQALTTLNSITAYGSPIVPVSRMPNAKGLYTHPLNLIWGIWRQIRLEFDKDITKGEYIIVLSTRIAFSLEEPEATVGYLSIG